MPHAVQTVLYNGKPILNIRKERCLKHLTFKMLLAVRILFALCALICAYTDYKRHWTPLLLTLLMTAAAIAQMILLKDASLAFGALPAILIMILIWIPTKEIGGGDVKLIFAVGLFFGLLDTLYILIISSFLALITSFFTKRHVFKAGMKKVGRDYKKTFGNLINGLLPASYRKKKSLEDIEKEIEEEAAFLETSGLRDMKFPYCSWVALGTAIWIFVEALAAM